MILTMYLSIKMEKLVKYIDFFYLNAGTNMVLIFFFVLGLVTLDRGFLQYELFVIVHVFFFSVFFIEIHRLKKGLNEIYNIVVHFIAWLMSLTISFLRLAFHNVLQW